MIITIASNDNKVSNHFGQSKEFEFFKIENSKIVDHYTIKSPGHKPGFLPNFLAKKNIDVIISCSMGKRAQDLFNKHNIEVITGVSGDINKVIMDYINDSLNPTDEQCEHNHEHGHHHGHQHELNHNFH